MNDFVYSYPTKVYFGQGAAKKALTAELVKFGKTVMIAYGGGSIKKNGIFDEICGLLREAEKEIVEFSGIMPNPTYAKMQEGAALVRERKVNFILAVGGGSVIDCSKVIAAQAVTEKDIWNMEFMEHKYPTEFVPMGAVVTASGTGAEMNSGAVITNEETKQKAGVLGAYAAFAVLDPAYTMTLSEKQVISGAFDTLSHCMETYFGSPRETTLSDEIGEAVMRNVIRNIRALLKDMGDMNARSELMWASAMGENGILKIGKVTDFQAHQIEHQLGAYTDCNHGQGLRPWACGDPSGALPAYVSGRRRPVCTLCQKCVGYPRRREDEGGTGRGRCPGACGFCERDRDAGYLYRNGDYRQECAAKSC